MPAHQDSPFLKACRREPVPHTPVWFMRQAGRYQPEYRAIREQVSFLELCKTPELAAKVTILPVTQLGVDAAILFADILLILEPLGVGFHFEPDHGPKIEQPIRSAAQVDAISTSVNPQESLDFVMQTIRTVRGDLPDSVPLIGFAGAPFTLASYAVEGGGSKTYAHTKRIMLQDSGAWNVLMEKLTLATADYLNAQIAQGVQAVQVFDSWVGALSADQYERFVEPHMTSLFASLDPSVPHIHFGTGNPDLYPLMRRAGGDVLGLDSKTDVARTWDLLGDVAVQGNLDSAALLCDRPTLLREADRVLGAVGGRPGHIFNLGHGMTPDMQVDQAKALVDHVHRATLR